jgi:hypothetical protein
MGKLKAIVKGAERAAGASDALRAPLRSQPLQGDLSAFDSLTEYRATAGELDRANQSPPTPQAVRDEIARREEEAFEQRRIARITDPTEETGIAFTHRTPEEYKERLTQLEDPHYSVRSVQRATTGFEDLGDIDKFAESVEKAAIRDAAFQQQVVGKAMKNPRYKARVDQWADGAFENRVFVHVDRQVDPIRAGTDDFVQFENPPEMGIHSGSNLAAERATIRNADFEIKRAERINADLDQAAQALEMTPNEMADIVGGSMDTYFRKKFAKGDKFIDSTDFEELGELLREALVNLDAPQQLADKLVGDLRQMSTASTTPHYFRGKNGLYLDDKGAFRPSDVAEQLYEIFPDDFNLIDAANSGAMKDRTKKLQEFIESKGYDHIVYHNAVEDKGRLSIINWNPDLMKTIWDDEFTRGDTLVGASNAASYVMALLGIGAGGAGIRTQE